MECLIGNIKTECFLVSGMNEACIAGWIWMWLAHKSLLDMILIRRYSNGFLLRRPLTGPMKSETSDWVRVVAYLGNSRLSKLSK